MKHKTNHIFHAVFFNIQSFCRIFPKNSTENMKGKVHSIW